MVPNIQADESGYLINAAALAGFWIDAASSYHAGYSLFLVPAFWYGADPHMVFAFVKLINSFMWGASTLVLHSVLKMLFPFVNHWKIVSATAISLSYPAWITINGYAFSESAFVLFFMLSVYFALRVVKNGSYYWFAWGISLGYLFAIHPKSITVIMSAIIVAVLIVIPRKDWYRLAGFFLVIAGMVILYKYGFEPWLVTGMTTGKYQPYFHYPSADYYLTTLMSFDGLKELAVRLSGHIMYIGLATLGLVFYPFISGLNTFRQALNKRDLFSIYTGNNSVYIYIGLAFIGTLLLSALSFTFGSGPRLDHWIYGRYVEGVILPLLAIGFLTMTTKRILASAIFIAVFAIILLAGIGDYTGTGPFNVSGFWQEFFLRDKHPLWWYLFGIIPFLAMLAFYSTCFRFVIIICVFTFASYLQIQWHNKVSINNNNRQHLAYFIRDNFETGSSVGIDINHDKGYTPMWFFWQYAFYLYDLMIIKK